MMGAPFFVAAIMAATNIISKSSAASTSTAPSTSTLQYIEELPQIIVDAIVADATGGFAGPGYIILADLLNPYDVNVITEDDAGTLTLSGNFERYDNASLPASTALYLYFDDGDEETDFVRGQGEINSNTGDFIATTTDIPIGFGSVVLSFVVVDPADAFADNGGNTIFPLYVVSDGCSRSLTIGLEWDTDNSDLDLYIVEPDGKRVNYVFRTGNVGYLDNDNAEGFGPENYIVYSGLDVAEDAVLGEYAVQVYRPFVSTDTNWTLTTRVNGEVVWIETGRFGDGISDDSSSPYDYRTDLFYFSLTEYDAGDCAVYDADEATIPPTIAAGNETSTDDMEAPYP